MQTFYTEYRKIFNYSSCIVGMLLLVAMTMDIKILGHEPIIIFWEVLIPIDIVFLSIGVILEIIMKKKQK